MGATMFSHSLIRCPKCGDVLLRSTAEGLANALLDLSIDLCLKIYPSEFTVQCAFPQLQCRASPFFVFVEIRISGGDRADPLAYLLSAGLVFLR